MSAIPGFVKQGGDNFVRNVSGMWDGMSPRDYIRIIVIVGAYLLLRPYLLSFAAKIQANEYAKHTSKTDQSPIHAKMSPNQLRDSRRTQKVSKVIEQRGKDQDHGWNGDDGDNTASAPEWGKKVKRRQVKFEKDLGNEEAEQKLMETATNENNNKGIFEFLVDYEEGKDGW